MSLFRNCLSGEKSAMTHIKIGFILHFSDGNKHFREEMPAVSAFGIKRFEIDRVLHVSFLAGVIVLSFFLSHKTQPFPDTLFVLF